MALTLYNPKIGAFVNANVLMPFPADQAVVCTLLLNLLIEMRTQTVLMEGDLRGQNVTDNLDQIRADVVSEFPVTG